MLKDNPSNGQVSERRYGVGEGESKPGYGSGENVAA